MYNMCVIVLSVHMTFYENAALHFSDKKKRKLRSLQIITSQVCTYKSYNHCSSYDEISIKLCQDFERHVMFVFVCNCS